MYLNGHSAASDIFYNLTTTSQGNIKTVARPSLCTFLSLKGFVSAIKKYFAKALWLFITVYLATLLVLHLYFTFHQRCSNLHCERLFCPLRWHFHGLSYHDVILRSSEYRTRVTCLEYWYNINPIPLVAVNTKFFLRIPYKHYILHASFYELV